MRFISAFPLLVFVLAAYNIVFYSGSIALEDEVLRAVMTSGALLIITVADLLIMFALGVLFVEILKATGASNATILDHILSTGVFILALVEFLLVPQAGNAPFLILVLVCFMDVVAGYAVSIRSARRDVSVR
jgi:steroid 5-alpha reductase family enzyme